MPRSSEGAAGAAADGRAWQLEMFSRSLKKQQKLRLLLDQIGDAAGRRCLLITNGDNNGALNWHFRRHGGEWTWVENEPDNIEEMQAFLGDPVLHGSPERIPAEDESFDVVVSIDVHEHLDDCAPFSAELARVVRPGGLVVVTTPNGDPWKPVTVLKNMIGMTKEKYGHKVIGYNVGQHRRMLERAGLEPVAAGSYSKLFTELLELAINATYVLVLSRKKGGEPKSGVIAPTSKTQLGSVGGSYKLYSLAFPVIHALSRLDGLLFMFTGYAVSVAARKPA